MRSRQPSRPEDRAFLPTEPGAPFAADDVEYLAEEFIASATSAESVGEDARNESVIDELGGPFLEEEQDLESLLAGDDEPEEVTASGA